MSEQNVRIPLLGALALIALGSMLGAAATLVTLDAGDVDLDWARIIGYVGDLGPIATALAAVAAGVVGLTTLRQRAYADARAEWWRRAQWAAERQLALDPNERRVARGVLLALASDPLAGGEGSRESQFLEAFTAAEMVHASDSDPHNGSRWRRTSLRRWGGADS
ncbi:hypothetical protein QQX09_07920 [Demequina sp. SYSU T00192]|uniref:Uncharacterized protein n=1 Tax=Demequina litoralis TaxID=3051660 RepID=A0ABT8G9G1_9MICO|nr:hypothetical protein [Demequina sp. SYSU T00192]MDN4475781.1 hypothetical protein [Demequina sp. SYSU T00192]